MDVWRPVYALGGAVASFIIIGTLVTEVLRGTIAFSVLVGLPAGIIVGIIVGVFVSWSLGPGTSPRRRRLAVGIGAFGVTFVVVLLLVAGGAGIRNSLALPVAALAGVIAAVTTAVDPPDRIRGH